MTLIPLVAAALGSMSSGCERKPEASSSENRPVLAAEDEHESHEGHDHSADDGHDHGEESPDENAGHAHGDEHGHAHGGEPLDLGSRKVEDFAVNVVQFGPATSDASELVFKIDVEGPTTPTAVRVVARNAKGDESLKVKANKVGEHSYDVHVGELPASLDSGGVLVVEIESVSGTESVGFEIKHE
jgi:hypothetical protein